MIRGSIVSGQFYPSNAKALKGLIEDLTPREITRLSAKAIILPHAGYVYSGKVAAATVSKILPRKKIIILGTNHTGQGKDFALYSRGAWETPFGRLSIDEPLGKLLLEKAVHIKADLTAHQFEHSIEVELPILYHFLGNFQFVPIACQVSTLEIYRSVALEIYEAIKGFKEDVLLIASSDMTHYEPEQAARRKDRSAMEAIVSLDEEDLVKRVRKDDITMCGVAPVAILLSCVKLLGAKKAQVAMYQTSGDASGDYTSVVGYAGIIVS